MLVRDCMTSKPVSVRPESDPLAAIALLKSARIRRMPVVDAEGQVVGLVTRHDLELFLSKAPSPGVLKRQHRVEQAMTTPVVTVSPDYPLEEAARLMVEHKVGSLPVTENGRLVGIITETDIFKQFVNILGGQADAIRLTVRMPDVAGQLAQTASAIAALGGNIRSVVVYRIAPNTLDCNVTLWVQDAGCDALTAAIQNNPNVELLHVWGGKPDSSK
jgi:acetoin utilization protein AcuB